MFKVWFVWGANDPQGPFEYSFDTENELNAFLEGVDAACGWLDCEQFDTEEERDEWIADQDGTLILD